MRFIFSWWYARLRRIDMQILWPFCVKQARDIDQAKAVFAVHAFRDRAWTYLGESEVYRIIEGLEE